MPQFIVIMLTALVSLWLALVAGMALGLTPIPLGLALTLGYGLSVALVLWAGAPVRRRLLRRYDLKRTHVLHRYGVIGLALLAPVLTGAHIGAALGMALNTSPRRLLVWMTAGAAVWSIVLLLVGTMGIRVLG